jgi:hypothetical protein
MKVRVIGGVAVVALVAYVVVSAVRSVPFAPAADLPRGALVYLQIEDLPAFVRLWNESGFKDKYLQSQNFDDLSKRHLGMKIASLWQEFSDALGMPIDTDFVSSLAANRAAVAVYDIGKLDMVFIAPMNATTFEATRLMQGADKFDSEQLDDGTQIYRVDVNADKGRQRQQVLFAHVRDRLIVATNEKLLAQTVSIITGRLKNNALADGPAFSTLAAGTIPKTAAVWVDQTALNSDYYFKRYWLMSNVGSLKNIRSGMFDLSISRGEIVEDRRFLLKEPVAATSVSLLDAKELMSRVPDRAPYYKIERASPEAVNLALSSVLSLRRSSGDSAVSSTGGHQDPNYDDDDYGSDKFEKYINETDEEAVAVSARDDNSVDVSASIASAGPRAVLSLARSRAEQAPLFIDIDKAVVMTLSSPAAFDRTGFEKTISEALATRLLISGQKLDAQWVMKSDKGISWRELEAPVLAWGVRYTLQGDQLVVSNEGAFLSAILGTHGSSLNFTSEQYSDITVLRPPDISGDFQSTFERLAPAKDDFFVGNILSLVNSAPTVEKIEKTRSFQGNLMRERLSVILKTNGSPAEKTTESE